MKNSTSNDAIQPNGKSINIGYIICKSNLITDTKYSSAHLSHKRIKLSVFSFITYISYLQVTRKLCVVCYSLIYHHIFKYNQKQKSFQSQTFKQLQSNSSEISLSISRSQTAFGQISSQNDWYGCMSLIQHLCDNLVKSILK